jgi:RNA polymerase sigma-54 factor
VENPALEEGREEGVSELGNEGVNEFDEFDDNYMPDDGYDDGRQRDPLQNEDFNYEQYVSDDETPSYMLHQQYSAPDEDRREVPIIGGSSLIEELKSQIYLTKMTKPQRHIAKWVLGNIDDDGYLRRTTEQLVDDIMFQEQISVTDEEMEDIVRQIKELDPPGVAAYDLQECLVTQLKAKPQTEEVKNAITLLTKYFEDFSQHRYDRLCEHMQLDESQLKDAIDEIVHLNQKPSNTFTGNAYEGRQETIIPDFYVENRDGELVLTLNTGDIPELHVSEEYAQMLKEVESRKSKAENKEAAKFIRTKMDAAHTFIDAIRQRNETLSRTMTAIMQLQREFFLNGDEMTLKPLILQDIATITGFDVSTISRVCNSKYVQTEFGIFPLRHFFSESMTNNEGEEVSTREIKNILSEVIAEEDKSNPLTDEQLVEVLKERGYTIARRTVAKYREQLNIQTARMRRQIV